MFCFVDCTHCCLAHQYLIHLIIHSNLPDKSSWLCCLKDFSVFCICQMPTYIIFSMLCWIFNIYHILYVLFNMLVPSEYIKKSHVTGQWWHKCSESSMTCLQAHRSDRPTSSRSSLRSLLYAVFLHFCSLKYENRRTEFNVSHLHYCKVKLAEQTFNAIGWFILFYC